MLTNAGSARSSLTSTMFDLIAGAHPREKSRKRTENWQPSGILTDSRMVQRRKKPRKSLLTLLLQRRCSRTLKNDRSLTMVRIHWILKSKLKEVDRSGIKDSTRSGAAAFSSSSTSRIFTLSRSFSISLCTKSRSFASLHFVGEHVRWSSC